MALLNHGVRSRKLLLNYLATRDHPQGRAAALFVLTTMSSNVSTLILRRLVESTDEDEVARLLRAMEEAGLPWEGAMEVLLRSSSSAVRRQTGRLMLDGTHDGAYRIGVLRSTLKAENPLVLIDTLLIVAELGAAELTSVVYDLLDRTRTGPDHVRAQVQACYTLGCIAPPQEVLSLLRPIVVRSLQATLLGGWPAEIRAAGAWALGRNPSPESRELLRQLAKDGDPAVSGTARLALEARPAREDEAVPLIEDLTGTFEKMP
jgi:HEAT repeat protein